MVQASTLTHSLQEAGLRLTPQRLAICSLLANTDRHPTANMIYRELRQQYPSLSLATVYNTLEALVKLGVVYALGSAGDDHEHFDADTSPHVNLACLACHQVIDLPSQHAHALQAEISKASGFKLLGARVVYYGVCPACQAEG